MVKPAPPKAKISLAPVKAMSASAATDTVKSPATEAKPQSAAGKSAAEPKAPPAKDAAGMTAPVAKAAAVIAPAPAKASAAKDVKAISPDAKKPAESKPVRTQSATTRVAPVKTRVEKTLVVKIPVAKPAAAPASISKAVAAATSLTKAVMDAAPVKLAEPAKVFEPEKIVAAVTPMAETNVAIARKASESAQVMAEKSVDAVEAAAKPVLKQTASVIAAMPRPPAFASLTASTWLAQTLAMTRMVGTLQAKMLDHACAELKATLADAETLARTNSPADAVALQAKAVRRSYESYSAHLTDLARTAQASLKA